MLSFFNLPGLDSSPWLWKGGLSAFVLLLFWLLARLSKYALTHWAVKVTSATKTEVDDQIIDAINGPVYYIVLLFGLTIIIDILPLPTKLESIANDTIYVLEVFLGALIAYRALDLSIAWYVKRAAEKAGKDVVREFLPLIEKIISVFIFLMAFIIILKHLDYDILSLVTALGVGSLAVGLAAKDTLANMISGFTIMIDRPFRVKDRVKLSSGETGDVIEVGLRSTKIKTFDHTVIVVPNSELVNMRLINMCYPDNLIKGRIDIGIAYGSDIEKAKRIMTEAALSVKDVLKDPPPIVFFNEFGDSALLLFMRFWIRDYSKLIFARDAINTHIKQRFEEENIDIPFPIRTVYMKKEDG